MAGEKLILGYFEKWAGWLSGVLVAIVAWGAIEMHERVKIVEDKIQMLQAEKVSRTELSALEERMRKNMEGVKVDIIDRIDWYFAGRRSKSTRTEE